jgi:HSP20 family protein
MTNENPSRESASRQQSAERSQPGSSSQQGAGTGMQRGGTQGSTYGQGGSGQESYGQGSGYGQGSSGQGQGAQGTSTWQGGRSGQSGGGALQRRGSSSMSPYSSGQEAYGTGPFSLMRRISDEMDRFFENFGLGGRSGFFPSQDRDWGEGQGSANVPSMWSPHIEVFERNGKLVIQADLPGIKRDDVNVRIEQDAVIIQGQRQQQQTTNQRGYYRSERSYGSFYRTIPLPEGTDSDSASASFRDGVLEIELDAPREQQRGRTLEIRDGGSASGSQGSSGSMQGGHVGTGSGATYGSGTSGSMQGSTSGGSGSPGSGGTQHVGASASSGPIHTSSPSGGTTGATQHSTSGTSGSQQASGSGTMYSGSGNPSAGAAGMGPTSRSSDETDRSRGSRES